MANVERMREFVSGPPSAEHLARRAGEGWTLIALVWARTRESGGGPSQEDVPYGMRVASDCLHLEEDPAEMEVLASMLDLVVKDLPLGRVAAELNGRGYRTRAGGQWTQPAVFQMLPRLVDIGPRVFSRREWADQHQRMPSAV
jgi:hypothetical protein